MSEKTDVNEGEENSVVESTAIEQRRRAVTRILATSSVATGAAFAAPGSWTRPVVNTVVLPAHATTSQGIGAADIPISGQIGTGIANNLLDLFLSPSYAVVATENNLAGGCIAFEVVGSTVTAEVTLNNGSVDSGSATQLNGAFTISDVHGATVVGQLDDPENPVTCTGSIDGEPFNALRGGSCAVIPLPTTTPCPPPSGTSSPGCDV